MSTERFNPYSWTESQFQLVLAEPRKHKTFAQDKQAINAARLAEDLRPLSGEDYKNLPTHELLRRLQVQKQHGVETGGGVEIVTET